MAFGVMVPICGQSLRALPPDCLVARTSQAYVAWAEITDLPDAPDETTLWYCTTIAQRAEQPLAESGALIRWSARVPGGGWHLPLWNGSIRSARQVIDMAGFADVSGALTVHPWDDAYAFHLLVLDLAPGDADAWMEAITSGPAGRHDGHVRASLSRGLLEIYYAALARRRCERLRQRPRSPISCAMPRACRLAHAYGAAAARWIPRCAGAESLAGQQLLTRRLPTCAIEKALLPGGGTRADAAEARLAVSRRGRSIVCWSGGFVGWWPPCAPEYEPRLDVWIATNGRRVTMHLDAYDAAGPFASRHRRLCCASLAVNTPRHLEALSRGAGRRSATTVRRTRASWSANEILAHLRACADVWGRQLALDDRGGTVHACGTCRRGSLDRRTNYTSQLFSASLKEFAAQRARLLCALSALDRPIGHTGRHVYPGTHSWTPTQAILSYVRRMVAHKNWNIASRSRRP